MTSSEFVLYYSGQDPKSSELHHAMVAYDRIKQKTTSVNIDAVRSLPSYVQAVPTLVIRSENRVLVGVKAIEWFRAMVKELEISGGVQCYDQGGMGGCNVLCFSELQGEGFVCSQQSFHPLA
jgi:hypothetical protein